MEVKNKVEPPEDTGKENVVLTSSLYPETCKNTWSHLGGKDNSFTNTVKENIRDQKNMVGEKRAEESEEAEAFRK
jgi:hypothetical protein